MSRPHVAVGDAMLGIDIGSTGTRAYLFCPSRNKGWHVENTDREPMTANGDFSSAGYPFNKDGPVYIGEKKDPDSRKVSLKYAFYRLAGASDELLEQYPLFDLLMEGGGEAGFLGRLREGLEGLLSTIKRNVENICTRKRIQVTRIGLSIPSQWTLDFEVVYRDLVARVFGLPLVSIFFHTETEALAHFFLEEDLDVLKPERHDDCSVFLFLDLGGHNMNGCTFNFVYNGDDSPSFYRIGEPFSVGGGSEHWTLNIGEKCLEYAIETKGNHAAMPPEIRHEMLEEFSRNKHILGLQDNSKSFQFASFGGWNVILPPKEVTDCFEKALCRVFEHAEFHIKAALKFKIPVQVVISGGTAKHAAVKARLMKICEDAGALAPHFVTGSSMTYSSGRIAKGVALAAGNCLTIDQFMARGAAFGRQMKHSANRGNSNFESQWDNRAPFLLSQTRQETIHFNTHGNDEFKIICDPFFQSKQWENELHCERCYDILYLGRAKEDVRTLTLSMINHKGLVCLVINTTRVRFAGAKFQEENEERESPPLPLYFDGCTNCAHLDLKGFDITTLGFGPTETDDKALTAQFTTHPAVNASNLPTTLSSFVPLKADKQ